MAILTALSLDDARRLGAEYGLDVTSVEGVLAGSVNSNFRLGFAAGGRVFARVYEEQQAPAAALEARLLDHLARRGVATPRPLQRVDGGLVSEHAGKPAALFPWIEGEMLCQARVDAARAERVGAALGRVHAAGADFAGAPPSRFGPRDLAARLDAVTRRPDLPAEIAALVPALSARVDAVLGAPAEPDDGTIHGDLFRDNVLWQGDAIAALLDFESASRGAYAFDLMVTLLAWCFGDRLEPALARALFRGYAAQRHGAVPDFGALHAAGRFAALRFTITRITDYELRPRGLGVYKDFRRFLARLEALEAMGPSGLEALLGDG